jgi:hypothetical protein
MVLHYFQAVRSYANGTWLALLMAAISVPVLARQEEPRPARRPPVDRDQSRRPTTSRPAVGGLPSQLRLELPRAPKIPEVPKASGQSSTSGGTKVRTSRGTLTRRTVAPPPRQTPAPTPTPAPVYHQSYDDEAARAGAWAAQQMCMEVGRAEYLKAGVYDGMRAAIGNDYIGRWDFQQGMQIGSNDREARSVGSEAGSYAAEEQALAAAEDQVQQQFRDLGREPRRTPRSEPPWYEPAPEWIAEPQLAEVFQEVTGSSYRFATMNEVLRRYRVNAWDLYQYRDYSQVLDRDWYKPSRAFKHWRNDSSRSSTYRGLPKGVFRQRFEAVFQDSYGKYLSRYFDRHVQPAYSEGYRSGWDYGSQISYEWSFRNGYSQGFNEAATAAAQQSFGATYVGAYLSSYDQAFDSWMHHPHPEVVALSLREANDDGVFEPGEEILADYELVNYGGSAGDLTVQLQGPDLKPVSKTVRVPARGYLRNPAPIRTLIDRNARTRSLSLVDLTAGDHRRSADLLVSYPLEMAGGPLLVARDNLSGRIGFEVQVSNQSRKPLPGMVEVTVGEGYSINEQRQLQSVQPGETVATQHDLDLRPLDLISGGVGIQFIVYGHGSVHDEALFRIEGVALDLGNRDLVMHMVAMSRAQAVSTDDILTVHDLVLQRLSIDWDVAVRADGNPYKDDSKRKTRRTALGDLVQTFLEQRSQMQRPDVFTGLSNKIEKLAKDLPGAHPFLRKYVKRLARQLE